MPYASREDFKKSKKARARRTREFIQAQKVGPCADCGKSYHHSAMDFDHVRGEKFMVLSRMAYWGRQKVLDEIAKCELVCANCHRLRTYRRRFQDATV